MAKPLAVDINWAPVAISIRRRPLGLSAQEITLPDAHAVVPENRVRRGEMEKEVGLRVLNEIVRARHPFTFPAWLADHARGGAVEVRRRESIEIVDDGTHTRLQFFQCLFRVGLGFGGLAAEE